VHPAGQRAHFDTLSHIPPEKYPFVLNTMLPPAIRATEGRAVPDGFHARFLTSGTMYTYRILNRRHDSALRRLRYVHVPVPLETEPMRRAAETLLGRHDFAAFQAAGGTAKTTVRTLRGVSLARREDELILTVEGDAFLYNMVRIIAGTLISVGTGLWKPERVKDALEAKDRTKAGPTAEARGLVLCRIEYEA
jgi:tRNA pseudouridine38-40 synthase